MGRVAEELAAVSVTVSSPDGNLSATARGGRLAEAGFREGAYERYTGSGLERQLAGTAALLYVAHEREVQRVMDRAGLHRPTGPAQARDESQYRYLVELQQVEVTAVGPRELVEFGISGMADWRCRIVDGTLRQLPEREFIAEAVAAAREVLRRHDYEAALLRNEFFGSALAPATRERMRRRAERGRR